MKKQSTHPVNKRSSLDHNWESTTFSLETLHEHPLFKRSAWKQIRGARLLELLSVPVIYTCVVPLLLLDLSVALSVSLLSYPWNAIEKLGCIYRSYANGLLPYIAEIAARTEQHFCPIKHAQPVLRPHSRYTHFLA